MSSSKMPHRGLCGPMYAQAIVDKLQRHRVTGKKLIDPDDDGEEEEERMMDNYGRIDQDLLEERSIALDELCTLVYEILLRDMDRRCFERGSYKFPAVPIDENNWGLYHAKMNIDGNRSMCGKWDVRDLYGFYTLKHQVAAIRTLGSSYLMSHKGNDDSAPDLGLHGPLHWILCEREMLDSTKVEKTLRGIQYRLEQQFAADHYLNIMQIDPPFFQRCCDFEAKRIRGHRSWFPNRLVEDREYNAVRSLLNDYDRILFPSTAANTSLCFYKGLEYLITALVIANLPAHTVTAKLELLVQTLDVELEMLKEMVTEDPRVEKARQRLLDAYEKDILLPENSQASSEPGLDNHDTR
ncbi:MAG: hypothetical protein Q9166_006319 [cf. Caloplaca sp. 2 TL-2023]